ncbi:SRPBCC family protein [Luteolibacter algae]|uniref:SRPBCC family protein n=1 Tax=Luteolibacter algae TaxID=454151 RepID=A0ABW5D6I9_9BACT
MIKKILFLIVVAIVALLVAVAVQPDRFSVQRSAVLDASPSALFPQVNSHRNFVKWNPFNELDPNVRNTFAGPESGVGAVCSWKGNGQIGAGSSTIIESRPNELVRLRMDWKEPMEGTSNVDFTFEPRDGGTLVTWKMYGPQTFAGKAISLFMSAEKMCGPMFEKGLRNLEVAARDTRISH